MTLNHEVSGHKLGHGFLFLFSSPFSLHSPHLPFPLFFFAGFLQIDCYCYLFICLLSSRMTSNSMSPNLAHLSFQRQEFRFVLIHMFLCELYMCACFVCVACVSGCTREPVEASCPHHMSSFTALHFIVYSRVCHGLTWSSSWLYRQFPASSWLSHRELHLQTASKQRFFSMMLRIRTQVFILTLPSTLSTKSCPGSRLGCLNTLSTYFMIQ